MEEQKFINPKEIVGQIDIAQGSVVADFGCGMGHFSLEIARIIGENGNVYAFDILPEKLESVAGGAKDLGLTNITTQRVNLEKENGSCLPDESVDLVVMKDMLFQNQDKQKILQEAYRILKNGGNILVIEWSADNLSIGPSVDLRIPEDTLKNIVEKNNFEITKEIDAGNFHYSLFLTKTKA